MHKKITFFCRILSFFISPTEKKTSNFNFNLKVPNPCSNDSCSHLCLLKPNNDFECACPDNTNFIESNLFTCNAGMEFFSYFYSTLSLQNILFKVNF